MKDLVECVIQVFVTFLIVCYGELSSIKVPSANFCRLATLMTIPVRKVYFLVRVIGS